MTDRDRAVVIGASIGGLLAARALADHFSHVLVIERDRLPSEPALRRGVPQGRHVHALIARGAEILGELFDGFHDQLAAAGAVAVAANREIRFATPAGDLPRITASAPLRCASRQLIEHHVRLRVMGLANVEIIDRTDVTGPVTDDGHVTGVRVFPHDVGTESALGANLVVDASGRGGRATAWLSAMGYDPPREEAIKADLRYVTRDIPLADHICGDRFVLVPPRPDRPAGMAAQQIEHGRWKVTLFGYGRFQPDPAPEAFLPQLAAIAPTEVAAALTAAAAADGQSAPVLTHRFPRSLRRRYDRLRRVPKGLVAFGDAICSFNPIYGQGMTVAAEEALVLGRWLASGSDDPGRFYADAGRVVANAWATSAGADLALPEVRGPRPLPVRIINSYMARLQHAAVHDEALAWAFYQVVGMLRPPPSLFHPSIVARVLRPGAASRTTAAGPLPPRPTALEEVR